LLEAAWRVGVVVMVAKPVVLETTSDDVDVTDETLPLAPVVTITVETSFVEEATSAEVIVVFDVLLDEALLALEDAAADPADEDAAPDETVVCVIAVVAPVDVVVMVVGVPLEVVVLVCVAVVDPVIVVLSTTPLPLPLPLPPLAVDEAVLPVPKFCLLWKMPSSIGLSMIGLLAAVDAATMTRDKGMVRRMMMNDSGDCDYYANVSRSFGLKREMNRNAPAGRRLSTSGREPKRGFSE
jgi:hypothetical protein